MSTLTPSATDISRFDRTLSSLDLEDRLALISSRFSQPVFTTSLGLEDQVLTWAIAENARQVRLATLQTGRLFPETLALLEITRARFALPIIEYLPDDEAIAAYVERYGMNGFYDSVEARNACCQVRKLDPLEDILAGADAWITGLRREQSEQRRDTPFAEWDDERNLIKVNPLADWSTDELLSAIDDHEVPVNPLHLRGYPSVGCEPCTRAVKPGEDERAGRWWWESDSTRECGLHLSGTPETTHLARAG